MGVGFRTMATPPRSAARRPSPSSARTPSRSAAKPVARAVPTTEEGETFTATSDSAAKSKSATSSARVARVDASGSRPVSTRAAQQSGGVGKGFYVVAALALVILIGALAIGPVRRSMALSSLDSFKTDGSNPAAITAADVFLDLASDHVSHITAAIYSDRGPVEAQVYLAKKMKLFSSLVQIADRPLTGEATNRATVTLAQRVMAIQTAAEVFDNDRHAKDLPPDNLNTWAKDPAGPRELALASMALLVKMKNKNAVEILHQVAMAKDADPLRVAAAIDGLAELAEPSNLGFLIGLLTGPSSDLAIERPALSRRIIALASPDHLPRLMELFDHPNDAVRAMVIEALGGPNMRMGDNRADLLKRESLGKAITPKLIPTAQPLELAAAIKAVRGLRLFGARDAILELAKGIDERKLAGIDQAFMAEVLGKSLICNLPEPELVKDGKGGSDDEIALQLRQMSDDLIVKLTAGINDEALKPVAVLALSHIRDRSYLHLRDTLDQLAAHGDEELCMNALVTIVDKTYARDDVVKLCGRSKEKWQKFLTGDRPRFERIKGIADWIIVNGKYQRISDGKVRLATSRDYINLAQADLVAMVNEPKFVPPLGLTRQRIDLLIQDTNMLGKNVKQAWAGALE
jgi:hypothetical protein